MKKNLTELVIDAIRPRHEMETVPNVYEEYLLRRTRKFFSCSNTCTRCEAPKNDSPLAVNEHLYPHLRISDYTNIKVEVKFSCVSKETNICF